ncbi:MAG: hypothetical protein MI861_08570, partial [Pirellulales bacterium]|nr:hypothetical protein [Pirellulales bacterium]
MRRVVKIGGSLFARPDLVEAVSHWMARQPPAQTYVIVGGGDLVDAIRRYDRLRPADSAVVHWTCVDLLQVTFEMASRWFAGWATIDSPAELVRSQHQAIESAPCYLVSVRSFYRRDGGLELPLDWSTTTDSLAAALCIELKADELVLLKPREVDVAESVEGLAAQGIVDAALPALVSRLGSIR